MLCFIAKHFDYLNCEFIIDFNLLSQCLSESVNRIFIKIQSILI